MHCEELDDKLRTAISTNTTVKYCAKPEALDISYMLRDFRCEAEFLDKQVKNNTHVKFGCLVKGNKPFSIEIPYPNITPPMHMSDDLYARKLRVNAAELYAAPKTSEPPKKEGSSVAPSPAVGIAPIADKPILPSKPVSIDPDAGEPSDKWG